MLQPLKVLVGPSTHYHQLKTGPVKYQKSKPSSPIWRILIQDEALNQLHIRVFSAQPSPSDIEKVVFHVLQERDMTSVQIVIPATVEKLCPGLQATLLDKGVDVYTPRDGFASGARIGREWEKFISSLESSLLFSGEAMASCEEIIASAPPIGVITTDLKEVESDESATRPFDVASDVADQIIRNRGRDPEKGRKTWFNRLHGAPLNTAVKEVPQLDALTELLRDPCRYLSGVSDPELVWDIVKHLKLVRDAEFGDKVDLLASLGATAIINEIRMEQNARGYYGNFFSSLRLGIRDEALLYQISLGVKEACNRLVVLGDTLVQFAAARVLVHYPKSCVNTLRRLPAHNHLEAMVQKICGGRVSVLPELSDVERKVIFHPVRPAPLDTHFRYIFSPHAHLRNRTPISPSQCFHRTGTGDRRNELLLYVVASLPQDTDRSLPLGDSELADRMTTLINERLARTGNGVTCTISPLVSLGDLIVIDNSNA